jgi:hypothetical protein
MSRTLAIVPLLLAGCTSSSGGAPSARLDAQAQQTDAGPEQVDAGASCMASDQCDPSDCVCGDGTARQVTGSMCNGGACVAPATACAPICAQNGGVQSSVAAPNVVGSSECNAFCAKALSLKCPEGTSCRPYFNCTIPPGECPASVSAELNCQLEAGTWGCDTFGDWIVGSTCMGMFNGMCAGDAGKD